ncbi:hypothetical protein MPNT_10360 [Candidatus Methylacidithermus pantelleriae]|uniref:Uncharacterized protein n=1 Tax=Candidatus Methylacidithermus pantelleriae TaxID=2744239 RepID=A0A8J2FN79_9BACT|nr:hypothetical protein MPNT_10360 [Candidatus Methylacidithermus pantelleriae]
MVCSQNFPRMLFWVFGYPIFPLCKLICFVAPAIGSEVDLRGTRVTWHQLRERTSKTCREPDGLWSLWKERFFFLFP